MTILSPSDFLHAVFDAKDPEHYILIWTLADKRSAWFQDVDDAAEYVSNRRAEDIYCGVGLSATDNGAHKRHTEDEVVALSGLFADVDFQAPIHAENKNYPPAETALELIKSMPFQPSLVLETGHGYHAWWLFKEPYAFDDEADRQRIKNISRSWVAMLQRKAASRGYSLDAVFDLSRILRIPGTHNCKNPERPFPVRCIEDSTSRLGAPEDVESFLPIDLGGSDFSKATGAGSDLVLRLLDPYVSEKFQRLLSEEDNFRLSCNRDRKDMNDKSGSGYDFSVANYCVRYGWTDQEIVDLLIHLHHEHGEKTRMDQENYYPRTIAKIRESTAQEIALDELAITEATDKDARQRVCNALGGMNIQRIIRYQTSDGGLYYLVANGQTVPIGGIDNFMRQRTVLNKLADTTGIVKNPLKANRWYELAQLLLDMAEEEDLGEDSSRDRKVISWLDEYLDQRGIYPEDDYQRGVEIGAPVIKENAVWVRLADFRKWLFMYAQVREGSVQVSVALNGLGAQCRSLGTRINDRSTTRSYWRLPKHVGARFL